jgi:hypothetical protein
MYDNNFIVFKDNWEIYVKWNIKWWINIENKIIVWEVRIETINNILKLI